MWINLLLLLMISCHLVPSAANTGKNIPKWRVKISQKSFTVKEGENTEDIMTCEIIGGNVEAKQFTWLYRPEGSTSKENERICSNGKCDGRDYVSIKEETGSKSVLTFPNVQMWNRMVYVCRVSNDTFKDNKEGCSNKDTCHESEVLLRVQSPLRPLWPALGILAQVVVLAIVILWCEKCSKVNNQIYERNQPHPQSLRELYNNDMGAVRNCFVQNGSKPSQNGHSDTLDTLIDSEDKATTSKVGEEDIPLILTDSETKNTKNTAASSSK